MSDAQHVPSTEALWCPWCGDYWHRQVQTGRKPISCPEHQTLAASEKKRRQRLEQRRAREAKERRRQQWRDYQKRRREATRLWQRTPSSTQDPTVYAVPQPGSRTFVLLPTKANGWREEMTLVTVTGRIRRVGFKRRGIHQFCARWVPCLIPGEKEPRHVAIERFREVAS